MSGNIVKLAPGSEPAQKNADDAVPSLLTRTYTQADRERMASAKKQQSLPETFDQFGEMLGKLLMDEHLEVSKVRPFFWSMVEAYLDRFDIYPFDIVKALFSYLETREYPPQELEKLVAQLENLYLQQFGRPMPGTMGGSTRQQPVGPVPELPVLDDEMEALRQSLKYAGLVDEINNDY